MRKIKLCSIKKSDINFFKSFANFMKKHELCRVSLTELYDTGSFSIHCNTYRTILITMINTYQTKPNVHSINNFECA